MCDLKFCQAGLKSNAFHHKTNNVLGKQQRIATVP